MPLDRILTALILGLSWERILCCPFFIFGLTLNDRSAGWKFIAGRLLGICILSAVISLIGIPFNLPQKTIDSLFGLFLAGLGVSMLSKLKHAHLKQHKGFSHVGFGLGLLRGMLNPGRKILYLLPLLWGTRIFEALIIALVYALSSSVYLLIGFISADFLSRISAHSKTIKTAGGFILIITGFYYLFKSELFLN